MSKIFSLGEASREIGVPMSKLGRTLKLLGIEPIVIGSANLKGVTETDVERLRLALVADGVEVQA